MSDPGGRGDAFCGINPEALQGTIASLKADADRLHGSASRFKSRFDGLGIDAQPLTKLVHIATWASDQLPMLRRRHHLAVLIDHGGNPFSHYPNHPEMVMVDEVEVAEGPPKASDLPTGSDSKLNADWWGSLSPGMKAEVQFLYPARIGAMDGLPAVVRDRTNRVVFDKLYGTTKAKLAKLNAQEPAKYEQGSNPFGETIETSAWQGWNEEKGRLEGQLKGMDAIHSRLGRTGTGDLPRAYLLGIDTHHLGHAIVANGDPDTADHTAVYVPGTTSKLAGAGGDIKRMESLWRTSRMMAPGQSVSTITWIGYDAPQTVFPQAASRSYADKGAPVLNHFLDGLQTAQGGPNASHSTVIGHSYGSTLVGDASKQHGNFAADDIVVAGSPGMLVGNADQLDVGTKHTWSEAAGTQYDQVPALGKVAGLGGNSVKVRTWHGIPYDAAVNVDVVPSDREFGANIMKTDSHAHGGYWDSSTHGGNWEASISLKNQAAVVTGNYDEVKRD
ncbi:MULTISPECIES: alpha/beta hydrolase [unclassified Streptomyces]|uniref:alpha/beta hydrolase n=1 Tax=unclassified Streptomyces TaxID=2593676 RepID=UPI002E21E01F|nr:alpha/beta hydrolase [Streptomyces sp. NBC_01023]